MAQHVNGTGMAHGAMPPFFLIRHNNLNKADVAL